MTVEGDGHPASRGEAALTFATRWQWPVVPGVTAGSRGRSRCGCPDP
ncbi:DNA primase, partial [Streptomyces sp. NPDC052020]